MENILAFLNNLFVSCNVAGEMVVIVFFVASFCAGYLIGISQSYRMGHLVMVLNFWMGIIALASKTGNIDWTTFLVFLMSCMVCSFLLWSVGIEIGCLVGADRVFGLLGHASVIYGERGRVIVMQGISSADSLFLNRFLYWKDESGSKDKFNNLIGKEIKKSNGTLSISIKIYFPSDDGNRKLYIIGRMGKIERRIIFPDDKCAIQ